MGHRLGALLILGVLAASDAGAASSGAVACKEMATANLSRVRDASAHEHDFVVTSASFAALTDLIEDKIIQNEGEQRQISALLRRDAAASGLARKPFCRVTVNAKPSPHSSIDIEIWLPNRAHWNGRLLGTGTGGSGGRIQHVELASGILGGYAVANTDLGTAGGQRTLIAGLESYGPFVDFAFGAGKPELQVDWAHRATHLMTVAAQRLIAIYYGANEQYSYFKGCSSGGLQALAEVQKYPGDYDGVIAEAPGNNRTNIHMNVLWQYQALYRSPAHLIAPAKVGMIHAAVLDACDALDGVVDGVIDEPRSCQFDPVRLQCTAQENDICLTQSQVEALRQVYAGPANPRTGEQYFPGVPRGAEMEQLPLILAAAPDSAAATSFGEWLAGLVAWAPASGWNGRIMDFDFDAHAVSVNKQLAHLNATDSNLRAFRDQGGKLILWAGTADGIPHYDDLINYYDSVVRSMGGLDATQRFARLFSAPGVHHCGGGPGPNKFDMPAALDAWVSTNAAPDRVLASKYYNDDLSQKVIRTRPLCAYPKVARWNGIGSTHHAHNFNCVTPGE